MAAKTLLNIALFQATWFASVLGAAKGRPLLGPAVAALALAFHLAMSKHRFPEARLIICYAALGFGCDTIMASSGLLQFASLWPASWPCPAWMFALWIGFCLTLNGALAWLKGRPWLAAAFGAVGGPAAYLAGSSMGAIQLHNSPALTLAAVAIEYALLVPLFLYFASLCVRRRAAGDACELPSAAKGAA